MIQKKSISRVFKCLYALAFLRSFFVTTLIADQRPNVLVILVDDLGWNDVSGLPNLECPYPTPSIASLAKESMVFTNAYAASPVCSPSRASLLTGKSPAALAMTAHIPARESGVLKKIPPESRVLPAEYRYQLPLEEITIAELLKDEGYSTAFFGKWHLAGANAATDENVDKNGAIEPKYHPDQQGFEINIAGCAYGRPISYFAPYQIATLKEGQDGEYLTDRLTDECIRYIETPKKQPFFAYLSYYTVHDPIQPRQDLYEKMKSMGVQRSRYASMVAALDENVGRLMSVIKKLDIEKETIVFFMSDNGGVFPNNPLRGRKGEAYEGGIRVPMMVRWPGKIAPATYCDEPTISYDLLPTLHSLCHLDSQLPSKVEGIDLSPLLFGHTDLKRTAPLFWHYPHFHHNGKPMASMIRENNWKLIYRYESQTTELYDLSLDLSESQDLTQIEKDKASHLSDLLFKWLKDVNAKMPIERF